MYISWIQIHGTAETWKHSGPCIYNCTYMYMYTESRFMELQNCGNMLTHACIWIYGTTDTWKHRTVDSWNRVYMLYIYINVLLYTTAEPWKHGTVYT